MPDSRPCVCILAADESVQSGLRRLLHANGFNTELFTETGALMANRRLPECACIIVDASPPAIDGLELQQQLLQRDHANPVIFLSTDADIPMCVTAIKRGAVDFLTWPVDQAALIAAVKSAVALHRRSLVSVVKQQRLRERFERLTPRERDLVPCIITGAMNKQIAAHLGIAEKTVKIHRSRVMKKLRLNTVVELIQLCRQLDIKPENAALDA